MLLLVGQLLVGDVLHLHARFLNAAEGTVGLVVHQHQGGVADVERSRVGGEGVAGFDGKVGQRGAQLLEERLLVHIPCTRDVPCGQPASRTAASQTVGSLVAVGAVDGVAPLIRVGAVGKEGCTACASPSERIVVGVVLDALLEEFIEVEGQLTLLVLHAPAIEVVALAVDGSHFRAGKEVDNVRVLEYIVPRARQPEVGGQHLVVVLQIDTAHGEYADGQVVGVVGVVVEPGVVLPDIGIAHRAIGPCLVGSFTNLMLACGGEIVDGGQGGYLQCPHGLPLQFALELHAHLVEVDVVVVELVLDVEW